MVMGKLIKWTVIVVVLLGIGAALGSSSSEDDGEKITKATDQAAKTVSDTASTEEAEADEPEPTPEPRFREQEEPDGRFEMNCDYVLPDDFDSEDYRFIAGGELENTGNVGIKVRVTYKWEMLGQPDYKESEVYRLRRGQTRDVDVSYPITSGDIDSHQSADGECDVNATIIDTFGKTPWE